MNITYRPVLGVLATLALSSSVAHADSTPIVAPPTQPVFEQPAPKPAPVTSESSGRFSGKRLLVEMLAGAVVGGIAGYAVYDGLGGGDSFGAAMGGLGANILVTPLVVWGTGTAFGGRGSLGYSYLGGLLAFSGPSATPDQAAVSFAVGMALMPVTSAIMYEVSSHVRSKRVETIAKGMAIAPVVDGKGVSGARVGFGFAF